jgi:hypothetical protein
MSGYTGKMEAEVEMERYEQLMCENFGSRMLSWDDFGNV